MQHRVLRLAVSRIPYQGGTTMAALSPDILQALSIFRCKLVENAETAELAARGAAHKAKVAAAKAAKAAKA